MAETKTKKTYYLGTGRRKTAVARVRISEGHGTLLINGRALNDFFTEDKEFLICRNHGAVYEPSTGICVDGPCAGQSLEKLPIKILGGKIYLNTVTRSPSR